MAEDIKKYNTEDIKKNEILFSLSKKKILLLLTRDNPERHYQCGKSQDKILKMLPILTSCGT